MDSQELTGPKQELNQNIVPSVVNRPLPLRDENGRLLPGQTANPNGRPPGTFSIRERVRQYLRDNPMELDRVVKYFVEKNPELMWQMIEGRPSQANFIFDPLQTMPHGEASDIIKQIATQINEIHGSTDSGGDGAAPGPLGLEAPNQNQ